MNAAEQARSVELAQLIASALNQFRQRFPELKPNLRPWRDDPQTRAFAEGRSLDLAFHLPGWSPRWQCRSLLVQLRLADAKQPRLMGMLISGMTFQGEQCDWPPWGLGLSAVNASRMKRFAPSFSRCAATWLDHCRNPSQPDRP